jgi:hypothetical protein
MKFRKLQKETQYSESLVSRRDQSLADQVTPPLMRNEVNG